MKQQNYRTQSGSIAVLNLPWLAIAGAEHLEQPVHRIVQKQTTQICLQYMFEHLSPTSSPDATQA